MKCDLIVVGAGPGGYETASHAAASGLSTVLVERDLLGGTCLNRGCIPTKALSRSAELLLLLRHCAEMGVEVEGVKPDYTRAAERKDSVVATLREGVALVLKDVTVVKGEARFKAPTVVEVDGNCYEADRVILASGSAPARLPIEGAEHCLTSDELLNADSLPQSMVIIGGGVIGMEFACIANAFGVQVTVVEYCKEILPGFDTDVAKRLRMALKRQGVNFVCSAAVTRVEPDGVVWYDQKGKLKSVSGQWVLMATGRKPVLPHGLDELGIELTPKGFVKVDEQMRTNLPGLFAVGDVNGLQMLAHVATAQGRVALGEHMNLNVVPAAVFTTPECAMVGLTEDKAATSDGDYVTGEAIYRSNGKALAMDEPDGLVKLIADAAGQRILGCHICGAHASDLIHEVVAAMNAGMSVANLCEAVHGHPTLGELVAAAAANLLAKVKN